MTNILSFILLSTLIFNSFINVSCDDNFLGFEAEATEGDSIDVPYTPVITIVVAAQTDENTNTPADAPENDIIMINIALISDPESPVETTTEAVYNIAEATEESFSTAEYTTEANSTEVDSNEADFVSEGQECENETAYADSEEYYQESGIADSEATSATEELDDCPPPTIQFTTVVIRAFTPAPETDSNESDILALDFSSIPNTVEGVVDVVNNETENVETSDIAENTEATEATVEAVESEVSEAEEGEATTEEGEVTTEEGEVTAEEGEVTTEDNNNTECN